MNRREFLGSALLAATGCTRLRVEEGVLDTHTHFYDPTRPEGVPWPGKDDAFLYRPVLPAELKSIAKPLGVTGTIVVEASARVEDNQWVLDLAKREPFIKGLVGHLKPGRPEFQKDLERFAANRLFRGIRVGLWDIPLGTNSEYLNDLRLLAARGLTLDVLGGPNEVEKIALVADALPELRVVVDHCAGVRVTGGEPDESWRTAIRKLAVRRNIYMKVSGLVEGTGDPGDTPLQAEYYKPVLDVLWNAFSEDRVIFGSNWPVSARFAGYEDVLRIVREYVGSGTAAEKYFRRNGERVYLG